MPKLIVRYRLPSMIFLQQDPLPELELTIEGHRVTIAEPARIDAWSISDPFLDDRTGRSERYGDVLRIGVETETPASAELWQECATAYATHRAFLDRTAARLVTLIRIETGQYWVGHQASPIHWLDYPVKVALLDDVGVEVPGRIMLGQTLLHPNMQLTASTWTAVGERLARGDDPPLPRVLWQEAQAFRFAGNIRSAVINGAMACEVALKTYIREVHGPAEPLYRYVVDRDRELSIFDYLDNVLEFATGKKASQALSHKIADGISAHTWIRRLFEARNKVAHEGRAYFKAGKSEISVDRKIVETFLMAASGLLSWLAVERRARTAPPQAESAP